MTDGLNNQFILGGINFDDHSSLRDNNSVFYLRNADISDFSNSNQTTYAQNALSNELCVDLPQRLVGTLKLDKNNVILFLKDDHNSYIKMLDTVLCTVIDIAAGECLNFQDDKQVTGVYKYQNGHIVIYFTDNYNPPRYLDLSDIPRVDFNECSTCQKTPSEVLDCKELKIWKSGEVPEIKVDVTSGNIPSGVYQIAIAFSEKDHTLTDWFVYEKKFNLHGLYGQDKRFGFILEVGCIRSKLDFQIALISNREDRGTSAQIIGRYTPAQTNISITEIDSVQYSPISLDEFFLTNAYYEKAAHVTNNGDHLIFADLTSINEFDYQPLANQIESYVDVIKVASENAHKYPSFMSDEVYPFYIQWIHESGRHFDWVHIPSNVFPNPIYFEDVNNSDVWTDACDSRKKKYWQVYNTAELIEVIEENDNGVYSAPVVIGGDPNCHTYKISTNTPYWYGTLQYRPCGSSELVLDYGRPLDLVFCTDDVSSIFFTFDDFLPNDVIKISEHCDIVGPDSPCKPFRLTSKYDAPSGGVNVATITWESCTQVNDITLGWIETCGTPNTYTGDITGFNDCSCDFATINVIPSAWNLEAITDICGGNNGDYGELPQVDPLCENSVVAISTFAYWESNIKYPAHFTNLQYAPNPCNTGIRYHKFPDRTAILSGKRFPHIHSKTGSMEAKEYVYILAPRFENISLPLDCNGNLVPGIVGYRIGYGSRENHKSILHKGLLYNMREETLEDCKTKSYFPNYPFNDLSPDEFIGDVELVKEPIGVIGLFDDYIGHFKKMSEYSNTKLQYLSPDILYEKNDNAATELITYSIEQGYVEGEFSQTEEFPSCVILSDITYKIITGVAVTVIVLSMVPFADLNSDAFLFINGSIDILKKFSNGKNYAVNGIYHSEYTKYDKSQIVQGNRRRKINTSFYMQSTKQKHNGVFINNENRENALFLDINSGLELSNNPEKSRVKYGQVDNKYFRDLTQTDYKTRSYYVGLKRDLPNQYGNYIDTLVVPLTDIKKVNSDRTFKTGSLVGGDIYITKHSMVKKFPFFTSLPLDAQRNSPVVTSAFTNVGFPKYWVDNIESNDLVNIIKNIDIVSAVIAATGGGHARYLEKGDFGNKKSCKKKVPFIQLGNLSPLVKGHFYTHLIGVGEYYCESEYIGGYREYNEVPQSKYYPNKPLKGYTSYDNILYPELYLYSQQQRFRNLLSKYKVVEYNDCCDKDTDSQNRVIFSIRQDSFSKTDRWLKFLPQNYHQFNQQDGDFTTVFNINDSNVLFLFDNAAYVSQSGDGILTQNGIAYLGSGSIFEKRIRKISTEVNGLGGCIDKHAVVNTPFGVFWPDRNRKTFVYCDGASIRDVGVKIKSWLNWFMDKPLIGHYDTFTRNIYWSTEEWTISFKPEMMGNEQTSPFVSFHDFVPKKYIHQNYNFLTYILGGIWKHNKPNEYQTYYGETYPFEVGYTINNKLQSNILQSMEFSAEFYTSSGFGSKRYIQNKFFDKFVMYNDHCNTGIKNLVVKDKSDPSSQLKAHQQGNISVSNVDDNSYRINDYLNKGIKGAFIEWIKDKYKIGNVTDNGISTVEGDAGLMQGKWFNVHLIASSDKNVKKMVNLSLSINEKTVV